MSGSSSDQVGTPAGPVVRPAAVPVPAVWAPVDACTLPTAEQPLREAEFTALFATALRAVERPEPARLRLSLDPGPGVAEAARDLIARESSCCSFFDFRLIPGEDRLVLEVGVPPARVEVLDGMARQAEAAHAGSGPQVPV